MFAAPAMLPIANSQSASFQSPWPTNQSAPVADTATARNIPSSRFFMAA